MKGAITGRGTNADRTHGLSGVSRGRPTVPAFPPSSRYGVDTCARSSLRRGERGFGTSDYSHVPGCRHVENEERS